MKAEPHFLLSRYISSEWSETSKKLMQSTHGFLQKQQDHSSSIRVRNTRKTRLLFWTVSP
jgi:hypothetical protein